MLETMCCCCPIQPRHQGPAAAGRLSLVGKEDPGRQSLLHHGTAVLLPYPGECQGGGRGSIPLPGRLQDLTDEELPGQLDNNR